MDQSPAAPDPDESGHTSSRNGARNARVEIIVRGEQRRSWTLAQKRETVA